MFKPQIENTFQKEQLPSLKEMEGKWREFVFYQYSSENGDKNENMDEIKDKFETLEQETDKLTTEDREKLASELMNVYLEGTQSLPNDFQNMESTYAFNLASQEIFKNSNKVEFLKFSNQLQGVCEEQNLPSSFYENNYAYLIHNLDDFEDDFLEEFKNNNVEASQILTNNLLDTAQFARINVEEKKQFQEKAKEFLDKCQKESDNYYINLISENTKQELNQDLSDPVVAVLQQKNRWDSGADYESLMQTAQEEKAKNQKLDGLLKNTRDAQIFLNKNLREQVKTDFGLDFDVLDEEEQDKAKIYTLEFLKRAKQDDLEKYKNYFATGDEQDRKNKIKAFNSLEIRTDNADRIIELDKKLENAQASKVFSKIADLVDLAGKREQEIIAMFYTKNSEAGMSGVRLNLLRKTHQLIEEFSELEKLDEQKQAELFTKLEKSSANMELLSSVLTSAKEAGEEIDFEIIQGLEIESSDFAEIVPENEQAEITELQIAARISDSVPREKAEQDLGVTATKKGFENPNKNSFQNLKYDGRIIASIRFETTEKDNVYYAGGLAVDKDFQGQSICKHFMGETLIAKSKESTIEATAKTDKQVLYYYINKVGFDATGYIPQASDGKPRFTIEVSKQTAEGKENLEQIKSKAQKYEKGRLAGDTIYLKIDSEADWHYLEKEALAKRDPQRNLETGEEYKYKISNLFKEDAETRYVVLKRVV